MKFWKIVFYELATIFRQRELAIIFWQTKVIAVDSCYFKLFQNINCKKEIYNDVAMKLGVDQDQNAQNMFCNL